MFIALEGIDGCGKSTAAEYIKNYLESKNMETIIASPVRDNTVGKNVRGLLTAHKFNELNKNIKLMLMAASHECCLDEVVLPAIADGKSVVMDRYFPSMLAYQGEGELAEAHANLISAKLPMDVIFFFKIDIDTSYTRMNNRNVTLEDLEAVPRDEVEMRVLRYQDILNNYPANRLFTIDANQSLAHVEGQIKEALDSLLK